VLTQRYGVDWLSFHMLELPKVAKDLSFPEHLEVLLASTDAFDQPIHFPLFYLVLYP